MSGIERTVRNGGMTYVDPKGGHRFALEGAVVQVHPDHMGRFDRLNVLQGQEPEPEAPKPRTRARKES